MSDLPGRDLAVPEPDDVAEVAADDLEELPPLGEIVDDEPAPPRPAVVVLRPVIHVSQAITVVVTDPHTRAVARHACYVPAGMVVAWRRRQRRRSLAHDMGQQAKMAGDHANALLWAQHEAAERQKRHDRRRGRVQLAVDIVRHLHWFALAFAVLLLLLGLAVAWARHNPADVLSPFRVLATAVSDLVAAAAVLVWVLAFGGPVVLLTAFYRMGRRGDTLAPKWARTADSGDIDASIDELTLTQALANLRIPQIRDYLKAGRPLQFVVGCRQEGRGTFAAVRLPGVPAEKIVRRRSDFAAGVHRLAKEVWPKIGSEAAILEVWIADKGALEEGAGDYPLLADGTTDVFKGVPFGRTLRGDPVLAPLMERNTLAGGMPGQGKSSAARVIMCGAALDPTAELWIMIPDTNFDFERMRRRCSRYVMGAEDERVETIRDWLVDLRDEVQARGQLLIDHGVPAVTRKLASAGVGLHPLIVLLEEAHIAITHRQYGKEIAGLLVDVVKLGRKRGIHVIVSTQAPTKDSMPRDVTRNCSNGIAFAVGDHVANDALLGQGAYAGGHRATELIPGADRGTALVKGFSGERSEMVQVYFLDVADGHDQVTPIVERSLAEIARRGRGLPGGPPPLTAIESRDLLDDLDAVLDGPDRVRLADLPARLREIAPSWLPYRALDGARLAKLLDAEGVKWVRPGNVPQLDPAELGKALKRRDVS